MACSKEIHFSQPQICDKGKSLSDYGSNRIYKFQVLLSIKEGTLLWKDCSSIHHYYLLLFKTKHLSLEVKQKKRNV